MVSIVRWKAIPLLIVWSLWHALSTSNFHEGNVLQEDFAMGACAGAFAAAATTPLDVIKTNMMCTAASRPTMMSASRAVLAQGGPKYFFRYCNGLCGNTYLTSMNSL